MSSLYANRAACFLKKRDYHRCVEDCHRVRGADCGGRREGELGVVGRGGAVWWGGGRES